MSPTPFPMSPSRWSRNAEPGVASPSVDDVEPAAPCISRSAWSDRAGLDPLEFLVCSSRPRRSARPAPSERYAGQKKAARADPVGVVTARTSPPVGARDPRYSLQVHVAESWRERHQGPGLGGCLGWAHNRRDATPRRQPNGAGYEGPASGAPPGCLARLEPPAVRGPSRGSRRKRRFSSAGPLTPPGGRPWAAPG